MLWTTAKLAEKSGLTQRHVRRLVSKGEIEGQKVSRDWLISDEEAKRFLREHGVLEESEEESEETSE